MKTLQERIAQEAMRRVGEPYTGDACGKFVREVLAEHSLHVPGHLRYFGEEKPFRERKVGNTIFFYNTKEDYKNNDPLSAGILISGTRYVGQMGGRIMIVCFSVLAGSPPQVGKEVGWEVMVHYVRVRSVGIAGALKNGQYNLNREVA